MLVISALRKEKYTFDSILHKHGFVCVCVLVCVTGLCPVKAAVLDIAVHLSLVSLCIRDAGWCYYQSLYSPWSELTCCRQRFRYFIYGGNFCCSPNTVHQFAWENQLSLLVVSHMKWRWDAVTFHGTMISHNAIMPDYLFILAQIISLSNLSTNLFGHFLLHIYSYSLSSMSSALLGHENKRHVSSLRTWTNIISHSPW